MTEYAIIGTGNMGSALCRAMCKKVSPEKIILFDKINEKACSLAEETGCLTAMSAREAVSLAQYILLGIKPHIMPAAFEEFKPVLKDEHILVTMAPGITMNDVRYMAGISCPVIRIMPNTPVSVGAGMTLIASDDRVSESILKKFMGDLSETGHFARLPEALMDAAGAVSGCGPAFADIFIEALADGGVACGLSRPLAYELAGQMLLGTARLVLEGSHPGILKDNVCSPGGTTIQGVRALEKGNFRSCVMEAVISAFEKTKKSDRDSR